MESETPVRNSGASGGGGSGGAGHQSSSWYDVASNEPIKLGEDDQVQRETAVILSDIDGHWAQADIQALCDAKILTDMKTEPSSRIAQLLGRNLPRYWPGLLP